MMIFLATALAVAFATNYFDPPAEQTPTSASAAIVPKPVSDERLLEIARTYTTWRRVSDQALYAPTDCRAQPPTGVQSSRSTDADSHGKKLYFLYAAKPEEYLALGWSVEPATAPVGQTIVKETFAPVEVKRTEVPVSQPKDGLSGVRTPPEYLIDGDKAFKTGERRELFIMTKIAAADAAPPGTDRGWVYATLAADGSKVIQSGAIASCMGCHDQQRHDRQFGLPRAQELTHRLSEAGKATPKPPGAPSNPPAK
jgi:hypothetical protein